MLALKRGDRRRMSGSPFLSLGVHQPAHTQGSIPSTLNSIVSFRPRASNRGVAESQQHLSPIPSQRPSCGLSPLPAAAVIPPGLSPQHTLSCANSQCPDSAGLPPRRPRRPIRAARHAAATRGNGRRGMQARQIIGTILPILGRLRIGAFHERCLGCGRRPSSDGPYELVGGLTVQEDPQDLPGCEKPACCEHQGRSKGHQNTSSLL